MSEELTIERLAYGGEGIAILNGKICFVEGALPGEKVLVDVRQNKKSFCKAQLVEVLEPSSKRIESACEYYEQCGGCQYQHVDYEEELYWKENQVRETFVRQLKIDADLIKPIKRSARESFYRNSLTLHETVKNSPHSQVFGFYGRNNRTVIPIEKCLLLAEPLQEVLGKKILLKKGEKDIRYKLSEKQEIFSDRKEHIFPVKIGNDSVLAHSQCFFQNNLGVTALIAAQIADWVKESKPELFIDMFSGVGTFTLLSASQVPHKICVEDNAFALEALAENLEERNLEALILNGPAEKVFLKHCEKNELSAPSMLLVDPPRQGLKPELAEFFAKDVFFDEFVYLSCHMGTLMRDIGVLIADGRYRVQEILPFDMFPRTKHVEVLARLKKVK